MYDYSFGNKRGLKIHMSKKYIWTATLGLNQHAVNPEKVNKDYKSNCSDDISEPLNEVSVNISDQNLSFNFSNIYLRPMPDPDDESPLDEE